MVAPSCENNVFWVLNRFFQCSWIMKCNISPLDSNMLSGIYAGVINVFFFLESLNALLLEPLQDVHLAAVNFVIQKGPTEQEDLLSVTLCSLGSAEAYLAQDPKATLLKPQHAWHHPAS